MKDKLEGIGFVKGAGFNRPVAGYRKFKSWKQGYKAGKRGEGSADCPYQLTSEIRTLLLKRDRWLRGWEDYVFKARKKKKKHGRRDE